MQRKVGYIMLMVVLALVALGIIMLFSTSTRFASDATDVMYANLKRQIVWLVLSGGVCVFFSRFDYHRLMPFSWIALAASYFLLAMCFVPHIGKKVNGSHRWLDLGGMTLQPSEFAKLAVVFFLASWLGRQQRYMQEFWKGFALPLLAVGGVLLFLLRQPDLGYTALTGSVAVIMLFCAGTRLRYLLPVPLIGFAGLLAIAISMPERLARLNAFMDVEAHRNGDGRQVWQALIAFGSGGPTGLGLGNSRQKMFWLPEAHTDFIFPIVGEELGMWVALSVVLAFLVLVLSGGWVTLHAPDPTGVLLGTGVTALIGLQALMNFAVVTSLMPDKGIPLPFISYGGSNLMLCFACVGVLFNIHRQGVYEEKPQRGLLPERASLRM